MYSCTKSVNDLHIELGYQSEATAKATEVQMGIKVVGNLIPVVSLHDLESACTWLSNHLILLV